MEEPGPAWIADRLKRYRAGDSAALEEVVRALRRPLIAFIRKRVPDPHDAEDLFQDVWMKALRALPGYRTGHFSRWLFRIARNLIIDRARRARPVLSLQAAGTEEGATLEERLAAPGPRPDDAAVSHDLGRAIAQAAEALPPEQREVFLLRMDAGLPFKDIARLQGVSINTALARMQYALDKMRCILSGDLR